MKFSRLICLFVAAFFLTCGSFAFSRADIISPTPGEWGNIQALVINKDGSSQVFYSLYGNDPLVAGFVYDEPIIINRTGTVNVRIASVDSDGKRSDFTVTYTVKPGDVNADQNTEKFIEDISRCPIRKYAAGTDFTIPSPLLYSFDESSARYYPGTNFEIPIDSVLDRYVPCTVRLDDMAWHFVIHLTPAKDFSASFTTQPFVLDSDGKISFTEKDYIYQIDDEYWGGKNSSVELDRSVPHEIRWQYIDYKPGNPVFSYTLPPLVGVRTSENVDGSMELDLATTTFSGKKYALGKANSVPAFAGVTSMPSQSLHLETVLGDKVDANLPVGIYYDGFYIGDVTVPIKIDRVPPVTPAIISSSDVIFSKEKVHIKISAEKDTKVYYAVSDPYRLSEGFLTTSASDLPDVDVGLYKLYTEPFDLGSVDSLATYYKVSSYAVDRFGNRSMLSLYYVVVDEDGLYAGKSSSDHGSTLKNFAEIASLVNGRETSKVYLSDGLYIGEGVYELSSDCTIVGNGNIMEMADGAEIRITSGANVSFENCILKKTAKSSLSKSMLRISGATLNLSSCELIGIFTSEASLISAADSTLNLKNTGLTVQSDSIATNLYASDSSVNAENCRITGNAPNIINMTLDSSALDILSNSFTIIGGMGRNIELLGSRVSMEKNRFVTKLTGAASAPVWKDMASQIEKDVENSEEIY